MPFQKAGNVTYYAIIMDMIGGPREFNSNNVYDENFKLFPDPKRKFMFTDDSILTMAVARAVRQSYGKDDPTIVQNAVTNIKNFAKQYPNGTFPGDYGPSFIQWAVTPGTEVMQSKRPSCGNGSAMRVSSVGWAYDSLEKTLQVAKLTAVTSHAHEEGVKGAQAIASAVYLARAGVSKEDIKAYIEAKFDYNLDQTLEQIREYNKDTLQFQSEVCPTTVPMAICAFLAGENFVDCGRKAISIGGDSDTIGAMAGSIAGAFYGMPKWLEKECESRLNYHMRSEAKAFQDHINSIDNTPNMEEIEIALASARVEQHALRQFRNNSQVKPKADQEYINLLADRESVRLFYEEVNKARKSGDEATVAALKENKADVLEKIKNYVQNSADFKKQCAKMSKWPGKTVKEVDYDHKKRQDYDNQQPQRYNFVPRLDKKLVPVNMVKNTKDFQKLMAPIAAEARQNVALKEELNQRVDKLVDLTSPVVAAETKDEAYYQKVIDQLIANNGEVVVMFDDGENELLKDVLNNLQTMKKEADLAQHIPGKVGVEVQDTKDATANLGSFDPLKLGEKALQKMKELSEALTRQAIKAGNGTGDYELCARRLASVQKLSNAVEAWCLATEKRMVAENEKAIEIKIPKTTTDVKRQQRELENKARGTMAGTTKGYGYKAQYYYSSTAIVRLLDDDSRALFRDEKQLAVLEKAANNLAERNPKAALASMEKLFNDLNDKLMNTDEPKETASKEEKDAYDLMTKQVSHLRHLVSAVDDAVTAPPDSLVRSQVKAIFEELELIDAGKLDDKGPETKRYEMIAGVHSDLHNRVQAIDQTLVDLKNNDKGDSKEYELAERAQEALMKIRDAVADAAIFKKDEKFDPQSLKNELATVIMHQTIRAHVTNANMPNSVTKDESLAILKKFEGKEDVVDSINEIKNSEALQRLTEKLTIEKFGEIMKQPNGLMNTCSDIAQQIAREQEAARNAAAQEVAPNAAPQEVAATEQVQETGALGNGI